MAVKSDIEIAQEAKLLNIKDVAAKVGITEDELEMYGKYKAKLSDELIHRVENNEDGKLVLSRIHFPQKVNLRFIFLR